MKAKAFEKGISPNEFDKIKMSDIIDISEIQSSEHYQKIRQQKINNMINKIKW